MKKTMLVLALISAAGTASAQGVTSLASVKSPEIAPSASATPQVNPPSNRAVAPRVVSPPVAGSSKIYAPT